MNVKIQYVLGVLLVLIQSCATDAVDVDPTVFYWDQTKCADPWETTENDSNEVTEIALKDYLENNDVSVQNIEFEQSILPEQCEACNCVTGQRIVVDVNLTSIAKMGNLGFYQ